MARTGTSDDAGMPEIDLEDIIPLAGDEGYAGEKPFDPAAERSRAERERERKRKLQEQVIADIAKVMAEAEAKGLNGYKVARARFPGVPDMVLHEAGAENEIAETDRWWQAVERIVDSEVIANALVL